MDLTLRTIRTRLLDAGFDAESIENICRDNPGTEWDVLDFKVAKPWICASENGLLQTICSGRAIMGFHVKRHPVYLTVDGEILRLVRSA